MYADAQLEVTVAIAMPLPPIGHYTTRFKDDIMTNDEKAVSLAEERQLEYALGMVKVSVQWPG